MFINDLADYPLSSLIELIVPTGVTIWLALKGFGQWKNQFRKQQCFIYAKELLTKVSEVNMKIRSYRDPFMLTGEQVSALKQEGKEIPNEHDKFTYKANAAVYRQRWNRVVVAYNEMQNAKSVLEIVIDKNLDDIFNPLDKCIRKMNATTILYTMNQEKLANQENSITNPELDRKHMEIMYPMYGKEPGKPSNFDKELEKSFKTISNDLSAYIKLS